MFSFSEAIGRFSSVVFAVATHGLVRKIALALIILPIVSFFAYRRLYVIRYPANLPRLSRIGDETGISWTQMRARFQTDCTAVFNAAYEQYSKNGLAVLIPVFGPHDEVILPPSALQWLTRQPDNVVSSHAAQIDAIQLDHSLGKKFAWDAWGGILVKTDLNGSLEKVCEVMRDELDDAFKSNLCFGNDTDNWKEINLFDVCRLIGGRATLRFTLGDSVEGKKLCRDHNFVMSCYSVLDAMLDVAGAMAAARKDCFRPLRSRWASRIMPAKLEDLKNRFLPLYKERMQIIEQQSCTKDTKVPQDLIQMMLQFAVKERPSEAFSVEDMTKRLAVSNFGTMHQTIITLHNLILDTIDSDKEFSTISILRNEIGNTINAGNNAGYWTKAKVASMIRADSCARETLRVHSFIGRTVQRLVVAHGGVLTEDGILLPRGTIVSILAHQSQTDALKYADPLKYDPFRHSRLREAASDPVTCKPGLNNLSFVSTSAEQLAFSHGKHTCPGRFLVDFELKMILAYAVEKYEMGFLEGVERRPANQWFVGFGIPSLDVKIRVKRRRVV